MSVTPSLVRNRMAWARTPGSVHGRSAAGVAAGRGHATTDVAAAMAELRRRGARKIALVGASMGGAIAVVAAAQLHPAAVVDLSGERDTTALTPGIDANATVAAFIRRHASA